MFDLNTKNQSSKKPKMMRQYSQSRRKKKTPNIDVREPGKMPGTVMFIGPAGTGKSTLLKQLGVPPPEGLINIVRSCIKLFFFTNIKATEGPLYDLLPALREPDILTPGQLTLLKKTWDEEYNKIWERQSLQQLQPHFDYFMRKIDEIFSTDYLPSVEDRLRVYIR